jgi:hypothetical protein
MIDLFWAHIIIFLLGAISQRSQLYAQVLAIMIQKNA